LQKKVEWRSRHDLVIDAAKAAIDVSHFDVARDILRSNGMNVCVLCLERPTAALHTFRSETLPICSRCDDTAMTGRRVTGPFPNPVTSTQWVRDYQGRKHAESGEILD
jgi:hypothetical protein